MWQIMHLICEQHSPKTNACQGCDQNLRQAPRLYGWSKSRLGIQLQTPKCLRAVHTRLAFFMFVNSTTTCGFFLGPVTTFGSPSSHCVMDFKFRGSISIREKRCFFSPEQFRPTLGPTQTSFNGKRGYNDKGVKFEG